uniref:Uncharacterized protein n=1 Tax=Rhizobium rhizogenes TaxID=359 RepID=A0A7S5DQR7_RHIRH|nr:hypothetical protein [Rhizobium rhizogenes]QCL10659.1 hypothetical protein C6.5e_763 [Rhizobium rhizogenes]
MNGLATDLSQLTLHRRPQLELIFDLHEYRRRLWKYGDGMIGQALPLMHSLDVAKSDDPDYTVSLGDIMITCGVELSLMALPLTNNRRLNLFVMLPIIMSEVTWTEASQVEEILQLMKQWSTGDETVDLHGALCKAQEIDTSLPQTKSIFQPEPEPDEDPFDAVFGIPEPLSRYETGLIIWALEYAIGITADDEEPDSYYRSPEYLVRMVDIDANPQRIDMHRFLAHIVTLSPPHALIGKGHSAKYLA